MKCKNKYKQQNNYSTAKACSSVFKQIKFVFHHRDNTWRWQNLITIDWKRKGSAVLCICCLASSLLYCKPCFSRPTPTTEPLQLIFNFQLKCSGTNGTGFFLIFVKKLHKWLVSNCGDVVAHFADHPYGSFNLHHAWVRSNMRSRNTKLKVIVEGLEAAPVSAPKLCDMVLNPKLPKINDAMAMTW